MIRRVENIAIFIKDSGYPLIKFLIGIFRVFILNLLYGPIVSKGQEVSPAFWPSHLCEHHMLFALGQPHFNFDAVLYLLQVASLHNARVQKWYQSWDGLSKNIPHEPTIIARSHREAPPKIANSAGKGAI